MNATAELPMPTEPDFDDIYRSHHRRVYNLCAFLLNSGDAAEDAAHEVFIRVQRRIETYNPDYSLSNWILKIASNYCVDVLRRRRTEQRLFVPDPSGSPDPSSGQPSPLGEILTSEKGKNIRRALSSLNEKFRIPLILAFYNDFTYDEIAAALSIPRNTVATLLFRGKQQLREKLKKEKHHAMSR
jgi:RNA polymerase sigma-70 factor (ECF subfamily)